MRIVFYRKLKNNEGKLGKLSDNQVRGSTR